MTSVGPQLGSAGARELLLEFLDAFENLDLARFLACWDHTATVIHPFREMARRLDGWDELQQAWLGVFDYLRATSSGPPYLNLRPQDLDVRIVGVGVAVATFHLVLDDSLGRRTVVLNDHAGAWKIVHLHASNV